MEKIESIELFSAAICNLKCKYCYIPKDENVMTKIHKLIVEKIKSGEYISKIKNLVGDDLTSISHWGTEPTLTLSLFNDFYSEVLKEFSKFRTVSMSTNFMTNPMILVKFIKDFPSTDKQIKFKIQMSLDGPPWITDSNRENGSAETIFKNIVTFVKELGSDIPDNYHIELSFKPTHDSFVISELVDKKKFYSYCDYFDNVVYEINNNIKSNRVDFIRICQPTVVVPGQYTKEDGLNYYKVSSYFFEVFREKKYKNAIFPPPYFTHFVRMMQQLDNTMVGRSSIGCSAGNTMLAIDHLDNVHICHRLLHENAPELKHLLSEHFRNSNSYLGYNDGTNKNELLKNLTCDSNDELQLTKMLYVTKGYKDFHKFKIAAGVSLIKELALCKLISDEYLYDDRLCSLLMIFMIHRECYVDSLLATGSLYLTCPSVIKLFGNGAFELLYHNMIGDNNV